jgi:hypothetical protein
VLECTRAWQAAYGTQLAKYLPANEQGSYSCSQGKGEHVSKAYTFRNPREIYPATNHAICTVSIAIWACGMPEQRRSRCDTGAY